MEYFCEPAFPEHLSGEYFYVLTFTSIADAAWWVEIQRRNPD